MRPSPKLSAGLRTKVTAGIVIPLLVILLLFTWIEHNRHRELLLASLAQFSSESGQLLQDGLSHLMMAEDFDGVQALVDRVGSREEIQMVSLFDTDGVVAFAPQGVGVGAQLDYDAPECQPCHISPRDSRPNGAVVTTAGGQQVFRTVYPMENSSECVACHDPDQAVIGLLQLDMAMEPVEAALAEDLREHLFWWAASIGITMLVVGLVINQTVLWRLQRIGRAMNLFGQGGSTPRLSDNKNDEIGRLASAFDEMAIQIQARDRENQALSRHLKRQSTQRGNLLKRLITAQEDERKRVARELHDDLGQILSGLSLRMGVLEKTIAHDPEGSLEQVRQTNAIIATGSDRMYELIMALRPAILDDLGLVAALRLHADQILTSNSITYEIDDSGMESRLPPAVEITLYRVFQEAMTNVVRHAEATHAWLRLACNSSGFEGEIGDNGRGMDVTAINTNGSSAQGLGLLGMQERISQIGGKLDLVSTPGSGTRIQVRIAWEPAHG